MQSPHLIWYTIGSFAFGVFLASLLIRLIKPKSFLTISGFILTAIGLFLIDYHKNNPEIIELVYSVVLTSLGFTLWFFWILGVSDKIMGFSKTKNELLPDLPLAPIAPPSSKSRDSALIELSGIVKVYDSNVESTLALQGIDLKIERGEFVAIMGSSGSGKSTLMHILGLLDIPSSGEYFLEGVNVTNLKGKHQALLRNVAIGFVFQQFNLLPRTSVLENVLLPTIYGSENISKDLAIEIIDRVGLSDRISHKSNQLSGGQIQRVAIARALIMNPHIILADEPTGNLDSKTSEGILKIFEEINKQGTTIILVTHEEDVARYAKRIIKLRDGEIVLDSKHDKGLLPNTVF